MNEDKALEQLAIATHNLGHYAHQMKQCFKACKTSLGELRASRDADLGRIARDLEAAVVSPSDPDLESRVDELALKVDTVWRALEGMIGNKIGNEG